MEIGAEDLGLVLERLPWKALREGVSRWSRIIGARSTSRSAASSGRWIARQASDPVKLEKMISTLDHEERRLLSCVGAGLPISSLSLTSFAVRGWGDLCPALERCARIGLLIPLSSEEHGRYGSNFWSSEGEIEDPLLIAGAVAPSGLRDLCPRETLQTQPVVSTGSEAELLVTRPWHQMMAKLLHTAGVLAGEPLGLTTSNRILKKELKRLDREVHFDPLLSADFFLSLLGEMELLKWRQHGGEDRLGIMQEDLLQLWQHGQDLLRTALATPFEFLDPGIGDQSDPLNLDAFFPHSDASSRMSFRKFCLWHSLQGILDSSVPLGEWFDLGSLCRTIAERIPVWFFGELTWNRPGKRVWKVHTQAQDWATAFLKMAITRLMLRLGFVELGVLPGDWKAAETAQQDFASCPRAQDGWSGFFILEPLEPCLSQSSGLLARLTPAWAEIIKEEKRPETPKIFRLGGDLEIHADIQTLDNSEGVLLFLAAEELPAAPGDRIRRFRVSQSSVARALAAGVESEKIRDLLRISSPPAPKTALRRVEEWLGRIGVLKLHCGWILGEWKTQAARDKALSRFQGTQALGEYWAILPAEAALTLRLEQLPIPVLRLDSKGRIAISEKAPKVARAALKTVASISADHCLSFEASSVGSMKLTVPQISKFLTGWSAEPERLRTALEHEIRKASGVRQTVLWRDGRVIHFDSALIARRTLSALVAAGIPVLDIGEGNLLLLELSNAFRKTIREEGFQLQKSEDLSCFQFPSGPGGGQPSAKSSKSFSKRKHASANINGRTMDFLSGKTLRKRIEDAISTQSSLVFLLRPDGRKAFALVEAFPTSVFHGPPLMVALDRPESDDDLSDLILPLSDIAAVSSLS